MQEIIRESQASVERLEFEITETAVMQMGGHIDAVSDSTSWGPMVDAGKFRLLVTYSPQRMPRYPNVPTLREAGYDMVYTSPLFLIGPKGIPKPVVAANRQTP